MSQIKKSGFTLIELLVVISIIALLLGILVPVLGAAKKNANIMKDSANLRNIHAAMATFGTANKDFFPGLTSKGTFAGWDTSSATTATGGVQADFIGKYYAAQTNALTATQAQVSARGIGATSDYAQAVILDEGATTGEQWVSTGETSVTGGNVPMGIPVLIPKPPLAGGTPTTDSNDTGLINYQNNSHAQLAYGSPTLTKEWKSNQNQNAVVFGTRIIGSTDAAFDTSATESFNSVWTDFQSGAFKGSVVRGDTSSTVENFKRQSNIRETFGTLKYGSLAGTYSPVSTADMVGPYGHVDLFIGSMNYGTTTATFGAGTTAGVFDTVQIASPLN